MERVGIQPLKCPKISNSLSKKVTEFSSGETKKQRKKWVKPKRGFGERKRESDRWETGNCRRERSLREREKGVMTNVRRWVVRCKVRDIMLLSPFFCQVNTIQVCVSLSGFSLYNNQVFSLYILHFQGQISGLNRSGPGSAPGTPFTARPKWPQTPYSIFSFFIYLYAPVFLILFYFNFWIYLDPPKVREKLRIYDPNLDC